MHVYSGQSETEAVWSLPTYNCYLKAAVPVRRLILEGWTQSDEGGDADPEDSSIAGNARMYKALRLCTDYRVFPDSGVDSARRQPRILGQPDGTACYKYVAWCADNAREFFDLSTDPYEIRNRWVREAGAGTIGVMPGDAAKGHGIMPVPARYLFP